MRSPFRLGRRAVADLPLRLLAGVILSAIVLGTAVAAAEAARGREREQSAREALDDIKAAVESVLGRPGSRIPFSARPGALMEAAEAGLQEGGRFHMPHGGT